MDIPYGRSNFEEIRRRGYFYVDKTPYLPILERGSLGYPLLLRPRRFGKSTFLSLLETYYDLGKRDHFDELFRGLWIAEHPTPERNSYLILTLDFSNVSTDSGGRGCGALSSSPCEATCKPSCFATASASPRSARSRTDSTNTRIRRRSWAR